MEKKELRKQISALKGAMIPASRQAEEAVIWRAVEALDSFQEASTVLVYASLPDEVDTAAFLGRWAGRKRLLLPLVQGDVLVLKEYLPERVHPGYRSIMEPDADLPDIDPAEVDLAVIPGVAFDAEGYRLGRGKGFYDRLLPSLQCRTVGVCYRCQKVPRVPRDQWDISVSEVISG